MSDVALLRGSQAAHTQPICHIHAQGSKHPAENILVAGHVTPMAKSTGGGATPKKRFLGSGSRLAASLLRSPDAPRPRPNHPPYPCQSSQRQRPRFRRHNGARRSPNRRFFCGPAAATEQPTRLPRPPLPPTTPWCRPGSPALAPHGRPTTRAAACRRLPPPRCRPCPRKRREPRTGIPKKRKLMAPNRPRARPSGLARRPRRVHTEFTTPATPAAPDSASSGDAALNW